MRYTRDLLDIHPTPSFPWLRSKIHLEAAELAAITRLADALRVKPEDIAYAALNRLMLDAENPELHTDIKHTREWRVTTYHCGAIPPRRSTPTNRCPTNHRAREKSNSGSGVGACLQAITNREQARSYRICSSNAVSTSTTSRAPN